MYLKKKILFILILIFDLYAYKYDLTIIGDINLSLGLSSLPVGIIDCLKNDLKINFKKIPGFFDLTNVPEDVKKILLLNDTSIGKVSLFTNILWTPYFSCIDFIPNSEIKIAYSMFESTRISEKWVGILNSMFDLLVLPDENLIDTYKLSGVTIPVFVLPCGIYLEKYLNQPVKCKKNFPFVFGSSAAFWPHKNQDLIVRAFANVFGNNPNVKLLMHGRSGTSEIRNNILKIINLYKLLNVEFIDREFDQNEYLNFKKNLDCYVHISKGEGFSITPREALALGIPCILSDNFAQKTICKTGYVRSIVSEIPEPAYYVHLKNYYGVNYNCNIKDVEDALMDVYLNYQRYLTKATKGREWVTQYLYSNLRNKYLNLVKPKKVILGQENRIEDEYFMTNSIELYKKYLGLLNSN